MIAQIKFFADAIRPWGDAFIEEARARELASLKRQWGMAFGRLVSNHRAKRDSKYMTVTWQSRCQSMAYTNRHRTVRRLQKAFTPYSAEDWHSSINGMRGRHRIKVIQTSEAGRWKEWSNNTASNNRKRQRRKDSIHGNATKVERNSEDH